MATIPCDKQTTIDGQIQNLISKVSVKPDVHIHQLPTLKTTCMGSVPRSTALWGKKYTLIIPIINLMSAQAPETIK